jgi:hypothetical protein
MNTKLKKPRSVTKVPLVVLAATLLGGSLFRPLVFVGQAQNLLRNEPPFDFSDDFYRKNGIEPTHILARVGTPSVRLTDWATDNSGTDPNRTNIRIRQITGGWDNQGNLIYYAVPGFVNDNTFSRDSSGNLTPEGQRARNFAENFRAFIFPKTVRNPDGSIASVDLSVALPNRRQDNVFETKDRYFCDNVLGLWIIAFTLYTQAGFNAAMNPNDPNHAVLQAIADRDGTDRDGTPILQTVADIDNLVSLGLVEIRNNPLPGGNPPRPRWVI